MPLGGARNRTHMAADRAGAHRDHAVDAPRFNSSSTGRCPRLLGAAHDAVDCCKSELDIFCLLVDGTEVARAGGGANVQHAVAHGALMCNTLGLCRGAPHLLYVARQCATHPSRIGCFSVHARATGLPVPQGSQLAASKLCAGLRPRTSPTAGFPTARTNNRGQTIRLPLRCAKAHKCSLIPESFPENPQGVPESPQITAVRLSEPPGNS